MSVCLRVGVPDIRSGQFGHNSSKSFAEGTATRTGSGHSPTPQVLRDELQPGASVSDTPLELILHLIIADKAKLDRRLNLCSGMAEAPTAKAPLVGKCATVFQLLSLWRVCIMLPQTTIQIAQRVRTVSGPVFSTFSNIVTANNVTIEVVIFL